MNLNWNSNSHPISDIRDWQEINRLEVRPDYQRKEVWSDAARIMLMDTILKNIPMPKIIFQSIIKDEKTYRSIIDGQQRISAILSFLRNEYSLSSPYNGPHNNKYFKDLDEEIRNQFLQYKIDCNEIVQAAEEVVREMYLRVNKYNIPLNKQELRRADFPGDFLNLSEELSSLDFFEESKIFTIANRRRMGDIEYISELLAIFIDGVQDKKQSLDNFYESFSEWEIEHKETIKSLFLDTLDDISIIFNEELPIYKTRFKQKADFYSLIAAISELRQSSGTLEGKDLSHLRVDLILFDKYIEPESDVEILSEYAIKCVSQSNTSGSRTWRKNLLKGILLGVYLNQKPTADIEEQFKHILLDIISIENRTLPCPICEKAINEFDDSELSLTWESDNFNLSNASITHRGCISKITNELY